LFFVPAFFSVVHGWIEKRMKSQRHEKRAATFDEFD
jgi:hypothetical protein